MRVASSTSSGWRAEVVRLGLAGGAGGEARQRRGQHVHAARAHGHLLRPASQRNARCSGCVRVTSSDAASLPSARAELSCVRAGSSQAHAQALQRAGEHDLLDRAAARDSWRRAPRASGRAPLPPGRSTATTSCSRPVAPGVAAPRRRPGVAPKRMPSCACRASSRLAAPRKVATKRVAGRVYSSCGRPTSSRRPRFMTPMRSASAKASSWSCVTSMVVMPSSRCTCADGAAQFLADLGVERAEGLVEQQHLAACAPARAPRPRAAAGRPRAARAGARPCLRAPPGAAAPCAARDALGALHAPDAQRELDVLRHGHVPEQRVVLEHEAHAALARGHVGDIAAVQRDAPVIDARQAGDGAQQRALAAAAGARAARRTRRRRPPARRR